MSEGELILESPAVVTGSENEPMSAPVPGSRVSLLRSDVFAAPLPIVEAGSISFGVPPVVTDIAVTTFTVVRLNDVVVDADVNFVVPAGAGTISFGVSPVSIIKLT